MLASPAVLKFQGVRAQHVPDQLLGVLDLEEQCRSQAEPELDADLAGQFGHRDRIEAEVVEGGAGVDVGEREFQDRRHVRADLRHQIGTDQCAFIVRHRHRHRRERRGVGGGGVALAPTLGFPMIYGLCAAACFAMHDGKTMWNA